MVSNLIFRARLAFPITDTESDLESLTAREANPKTRRIVEIIIDVNETLEVSID